MFLYLWKAEGRPIVIHVLFYLRPVAKAPQLEGRGQYHFVYEIPAAVCETFPQRWSYYVFLIMIFDVGKTLNAEVLGPQYGKSMSRHI